MILHSEIDDFIGVFDTDIDCQPFIDYYERASASNITWYHRNEPEREDMMTTLNVANPELLLMNIPGRTVTDYVKAFNDVVSECLDLYAVKYPQLNAYQFQTLHINVKKTIPKQGYHVWHCENNDPGYTRRIIATMMYLNDVHHGGETEFLHQHRRVVPKAGRVVIWPAGFTHMHRGNPPLKEEKYTLTSWYEQFKL
ncbi:2OG-Fe(II) oxygenase family enzyme [Synechococcus phage S-RS29]|nr:2OG-Fe(II) oxygenase family enzyme [Synechococcus phage S-RS29]